MLGMGKKKKQKKLESFSHVNSGPKPLLLAARRGPKLYPLPSPSRDRKGIPAAALQGLHGPL